MTTRELDKRYDPSSFEKRWYEHWEKSGFFAPDGEGEPYSIVIPPPNVTGRLHLGHALVNTLQDVLIRWKRMSGYDTLWVPGVDHAGIATQMVVERQLAEQGLSRHDLGREAFLEKVWAWKEENGSAIVDQLKRLGVSCDWSRSRFTLEEDLSKTVTHVFVKLYDEGLIYRGTRMITWCPRCQTAISDLEVEHEERSGSLWNIDYPFADGSGHLTVATTRPETMLGDTAVAVHPDDDRYKDAIGKMIALPLTDRQIPVIADGILVDPEFGSGAVKITPAHDRNDYEAGKRNNLDSISVMDQSGLMSEEAGEKYAGLERFEARKQIVADLQAKGLLSGVEANVHSIGLCSRCRTVAEPRISTQWFVEIEPLAKPAIEAVASKNIELVPESWERTWFAWMENIHDWCISRQLWWGHRIPAWYCDCGEVIVSEETPDFCPTCESGDLTQDRDVLDTWFSSGLWPFSTMGWPEKTSDFERYYPTSVLVTGFDILFFWVARMIMMGLHFTGERPFAQVYLHGLVRDEHGQKMSKTRGNVIDPLEVADEFGADAVRFTLAILSTGRDIPLAKSRMQGYAAFANKLWNAARFAMMNLGEDRDETAIDFSSSGIVERWILTRISQVANEVDEQLTGYRFDEAANTLYHFVWHELCDWYIEMVKPVLFGQQGSEDDQRAVRKVLVEVLDRSLRLLHPFMPFITEEIRNTLLPDADSIMISEYPQRVEEWNDPEAVTAIEGLQGIVSTVRNVRAERGYKPGDRLPLSVRCTDEKSVESLRELSYLVEGLARLESLTIVETLPEDAHRDVIGPYEIGITFPVVELTPEQLEKTQKQIDDLRREVGNLEKRLGNEQFLERAPDNVVADARGKLVEYKTRIETLEGNL